jgi:phosphoribosylglycinamide formyltransferase-1
MDVACVVASNSTAGGLDKARLLSIPNQDILIINPNDYRGEDNKVDQNNFGQKIVDELKQRNVTVVTQNGWLPLTPEIVIQEFEGRIFNQHPGPVPEFGGKGMYGRRVHAARLLFARMVKRDYWTLATGQRVHKDFDLGKVVKSAQVEILPTDTVDDLQQRVLPVEHQVQIEMLKDFVNNRLTEVSIRESLILPGEEDQLALAKKMAIMLYPHG